MLLCPEPELDPAGADVDADDDDPAAAACCWRSLCIVAGVEEGGDVLGAEEVKGAVVDVDAAAAAAAPAGGVFLPKFEGLGICLDF